MGDVTANAKIRNKSKRKRIKTEESDCESEELEQNGWIHLPDIAVLQIYENLSDHDRFSMALVCRNWARIFESPKLWRERRYIFGSPNADRTAERACQFLKAFGQHMRTLTIGFLVPQFRAVIKIARAAEIFFKKMTFMRNLRVEEFTLLNAHMDRFWQLTIPRQHMISALCRFIRRLHKLSVINLVAAHMNIADGCRVLNSLARGKAAESLTTMFVEDMFQRHFVPCRSRRYSMAMCKFRNLRVLYLNYNMINEEILQHFGNMDTSVEQMTITLDTIVTPRVISSETWREFRNKCKSARFVLYVYAAGFGQIVTDVLVRGMSLHEMEIVSWPSQNESRAMMDAQMPNLLRHIGSTFHRTLERFSLNMERHSPFDAELLFLLGRCRRLRDLCLYCNLKVETVEEMCSMQEGGKMSMCNLMIFCSSPEQNAQICGSLNECDLAMMLARVWPQPLSDLDSLSLAVHGLSSVDLERLTSTRRRLIRAVLSRKNQVT